MQAHNRQIPPSTRSLHYVRCRCCQRLSRRTLRILLKPCGQHLCSINVSHPAYEKQNTDLLASILGNNQLLDTCIFRGTLCKRFGSRSHLGNSDWVFHIPVVASILPSFRNMEENSPRRERYKTVWKNSCWRIHLGGIQHQQHPLALRRHSGNLSLYFPQGNMAQPLRTRGIVPKPIEKAALEKSQCNRKNLSVAFRNICLQEQKVRIQINPRTNSTTKRK